MRPTATTSFTVAEDGTPVYQPSTDLDINLCLSASSVALADGWEAEDGEEMSVLLLSDSNGRLRGALPAPAADETWLSAFDTAERLIVTTPTGPHTLQVTAP